MIYCLMVQKSGSPVDRYLESRLRPIFEAIVAGFRGKVALKNRTLGVPGS